MNDPNLLTLFGAILGIAGSLMLSIDALGAPDFLSALKEERERGWRMTEIGFLALINTAFVYVATSLISLFTTLVVTGGNLVISLLIAPFPYFIWKFISFACERLVKAVKRLGPRGNPWKRAGLLQQGLGCTVYLIHFALWVVPYLIVFLIATVVKYGLDLPLTAISELSFVPVVKQIYLLSSKVVADEKKWHLKRNALAGSVFIFFGFLYQFVATLIQLRRQ